MKYHIYLEPYEGEFVALDENGKIINICDAVKLLNDQEEKIKQLEKLVAKSNHGY